MNARTLRGPRVPPFYAADIGRRVVARARRGQTAIAMHFGQPSAGAPAAAVAAAHTALDTDTMGYTELESLRQRIAEHYRETYGIALDPRRVLLTAGASAGLVACFAAMFRPGDRVAVLRPGYPAYRNTLQALGMEAVEIPCGQRENYELSPELLAAVAPTPRGLILASPANPTGAMLDRRKLHAIMQICRERGIEFISDEIYHGISYGERAVSALEIASDALVINSFSKLFRMPGWRLGWMVVPDAWVEPISAYLINLFLTPPVVAQHAALAAMDARDDLAQSVAIYARNRMRLLQGLRALGIAEIAPPNGAFYLYANVAHVTRDSLRFCTRLVDETGVAIAPGIDFDPIDGQRFVRFSFAVSEAEIEHALQLLADWLPRYRD